MVGAMLPLKDEGCRVGELIEDGLAFVRIERGLIRGFVEGIQVGVAPEYDRKLYRTPVKAVGVGPSLAVSRPLVHDSVEVTDRLVSFRAPVGMNSDVEAVLFIVIKRLNVVYDCIKLCRRTQSV